MLYWKYFSPPLNLRVGGERMGGGGGNSVNILGFKA